MSQKDTSNNLKQYLSQYFSYFFTNILLSKIFSISIFLLGTIRNKITLSFIAYLCLFFVAPLSQAQTINNSQYKCQDSLDQRCQPSKQYHNHLNTDNQQTMTKQKPLFEADSTELKIRTAIIIPSSLIVIGILSILPDNVSGWEDSGTPEDWWDNVSQPPVWDNDHYLVNYVGHPYFGAVYYMSARDSGYRPFDSFVYSALMSAFLWEYGVEAFHERPSIQDLIVTPVGGWLVGEYTFVPIYQYIDNNNGQLFGSSTIGSVVKFIVNPTFNLSRILGFQTKSYLSLETNYLGRASDLIGNNVSNLGYDQTHSKYAMLSLHVNLK